MLKARAFTLEGHGLIAAYGWRSLKNRKCGQEVAMKHPLVSILINNFNYAHYLGATIDSALEQTYDNIEAIVVDDGSTDNSKEVIAAYKERVIPILKENGGQASAVNAGFAASKGDLIVLLDSDDLLLPGVIDDVVKCFERNANAVKCQFRLQVIDATGHLLKGILPPLRIKQPRGDITRLLAQRRSYAHPPTSGNVFRRSAIAGLMPIPENVYRKGAPAYLIYNVGLFGEIESIDAVGGLYRMHSTNSTSKKPYLDGPELKAHLEEDICARHRQMALFKKIRGEVIPEIGLADLTHIKKRVALKKLHPEHYNHKGMLLTLCLRGVVASFLYSDTKAMDRPLWALWFLLIFVVPRGGARRLIQQATDHQKRAGFLQLLLGNRDRRV